MSPYKEFFLVPFLGQTYPPFLTPSSRLGLPRRPQGTKFKNRFNTFFSNWSEHLIMSI